MIILQYIGLGAKKYGGLERYMIELCRGCNERGHKIIIVFSETPKSKIYTEKLANLGIEWHIIHNHPKEFITKSYSLIKNKKPDIIQTHFVDTRGVVLLNLLSKIANKGKTIQFDYEHCNVEVSSLKIKIALNLIIKINEKLFFVSKGTCNNIKQRFPHASNLETKYLGIEQFIHSKDEVRRKYNLPNKIIIANVSYHARIKGVDILLKAINHLVYNLKVNNFIVYQIGGEGKENSKELEKLATDLKIEGYIHWMGIQENVPEILCGCDIYCHTSRSEGVPLSIMEADLAGLPIVATDVGGIKEATNKLNSILVPNEDYIAVANNLKKLILDENLRSCMGKEGKIIANKKFSINNQATSLIKEYETSFKKKKKKNRI